MASLPRPRGRLPKPRDPFAPVPSPTKKAASSGSGRPRGRPPKKAKTAASSAPTVARREGEEGLLRSSRLSRQLGVEFSSAQS